MSQPTCRVCGQPWAVGHVPCPYCDRMFYRRFAAGRPVEALAADHSIPRDVVEECIRRVLLGKTLLVPR